MMSADMNIDHAESSCGIVEGTGMLRLAGSLAVAGPKASARGDGASVPLPLDAGTFCAAGSGNGWACRGNTGDVDVSAAKTHATALVLSLFMHLDTHLIRIRSSPLETRHLLKLTLSTFEAVSIRSRQPAKGPDSPSQARTPFSNTVPKREQT